MAVRVKVPLRRGYVIGASLPSTRSRGTWSRSEVTETLSDKQAAAYEALMGRPWSDEDPRREDYGAPEYPSDVRFGDPRWEEAYAEYDAAMAAWQTSPEAAQYDADWARWYARREQFNYSPRARNAKDVLAKARVS